MPGQWTRTAHARAMRSRSPFRGWFPWISASRGESSPAAPRIASPSFGPARGSSSRERGPRECASHRTSSPSRPSAPRRATPSRRTARGGRPEESPTVYGAWGERPISSRAHAARDAEKRRPRPVGIARVECLAVDARAERHRGEDRLGRPGGVDVSPPSSRRKAGAARRADRRAEIGRREPAALADQRADPARERAARRKLPSSPVSSRCACASTNPGRSARSPRSVGRTPSARARRRRHADRRRSSRPCRRGRARHRPGRASPGRRGPSVRRGGEGGHGLSLDLERLSSAGPGPSGSSRR